VKLNESFKKILNHYFKIIRKIQSTFSEHFVDLSAGSAAAAAPGHSGS
jgi:hypothetical protein